MRPGKWFFLFSPFLCILPFCPLRDPPPTFRTTALNEPNTKYYTKLLLWFWHTPNISLSHTHTLDDMIRILVVMTTWLISWIYWLVVFLLVLFRYRDYHQLCRFLVCRRTFNLIVFPSNSHQTCFEDLLHWNSDPHDSWNGINKLKKKSFSTYPALKSKDIWKWCFHQRIPSLQNSGGKNTGFPNIIF